MMSRIAQRAARRGRLPPTALYKRTLNYGTPEYVACFENLPQIDTQMLRDNANKYLATKFDPQVWHDDPISTLLNGVKLEGGASVDTTDAFGSVNGKQIHATREQIDSQIIPHIKTYKSPYTDAREIVRQVEENIFTNYHDFLIANQCKDFGKQDGVTEIEEAIQANTIERRLNDQLLFYEQMRNKIKVNRQPIYVTCVSNFTNFLDLSRKTLRSLEVGIPCVILCRSNTAQHSFRWAQLLQDQCKEQGLDPGMVTFVSATLSDIQYIIQECKDHTGNLYATTSRDLAKTIKSQYEKSVISTQGPNTIIVTGGIESMQMQEAIKTSATIESSGQCTALRHCVVPANTDDDKILGVFDRVESFRGEEGAEEALKNGRFDSVYHGHKGSEAPDRQVYKRHGVNDAYVKIEKSLPSTDIKEYWRKVAVDFSKLDLEGKANAENMEQVSAWLNTTQPISLVVNGPRKSALKTMRSLFLSTGMVVYTVGGSGKDGDTVPPALTCQARPQEGECFGEFPPRLEMEELTKFPVLVPSSNPSYDAQYQIDYLTSKAETEDTEYYSKGAKLILSKIENAAIRGYCLELIMYLQTATLDNPKMLYSRNRSGLWGLQKPPLGWQTVLRCDADTTIDQLAPVLTVFYITTARQQLEISVDPANKAIIALCKELKMAYTEESESDANGRIETMKGKNLFNHVHASKRSDQDFCLAGLFVSRYLPLGHVKSTKKDDDEFYMNFSGSSKWLTTVF